MNAKVKKSFKALVGIALAGVMVAAMGWTFSGLAAVSPPSPADPDTPRVVIFSPTDDADRNAQLKSAVLKQLATGPAGSTLHFHLGKEHVASVTLPEGSVNRRKRDPEVKRAAVKIQAAFEAVPPDADGQIDLSGLGAIVQARSGGRAALVSIYADARYLDESQGAFNHVLNHVTTDGSIGHEWSPFQTTEQMEGSKVVWVTPSAEWGSSSRHQSEVRRFNALYIQSLGAQLLRTSDNLGELFNFNVDDPVRITARDTPPGYRQGDRISEATGDQSTQTFTQNNRPADESGTDAIQPADGPEEVLKAAEADKSKIAIVFNWVSDDPGADVDLYVTSQGERGELHYSQIRTPFGRHFGDVRRSGTSTEGHDGDFSRSEWVLIDHSRLQDLTVHANTYRARDKVRLTVIRVYQGERGIRVIDLPESPGDGGTDRNRRGPSAAWNRIALYGHGAREDRDTL